MEKFTEISLFESEENRRYLPQLKSDQGCEGTVKSIGHCFFAWRVN